eukprot:CAMPEP_0177678084 /NCGR_PEP_ID=MMETSP0447-20121125/28810_1 /TAXON_ID=0 /ORGANISM="Stygamoeba regulata, Strain BSH-02190019" /LENGTH=211 /DNA_ID=CAMNT_0019187043 /DNA_START=44 /DNA_END=675 /DNA_ORIENTATION=+
MKPGRLSPRECLFLLCDIQARFAPVIQNFSSVSFIANQMVNVAKILDVDVVCTEQYPKAFGHTVPEIETSHLKVYEKTCFSMFGHPESQKAILNSGKKKAVLFGIEAHVCISQTALDLVENGFEVHILADGTSSQRQEDRMFAFERLRQSGVFITTSEAMIFELMGDATHPRFRDLSAIIKEANKAAPSNGAFVQNLRGVEGEENNKKGVN